MIRKLGAVVILTAFILSACSSQNSIPREQIDSFAKCLTESGTVMYGTFWCPHCAKTKKMFGSSFQYVNYVECDPRGDNERSEYCIEKKIDKYDTWEFPDGTRFISEPTFEDLAQGSGCPAPGVA